MNRKLLKITGFIFSIWSLLVLLQSCYDTCNGVQGIPAPVEVISASMGRIIGIDDTSYADVNELNVIVADSGITLSSIRFDSLAILMDHEIMYAAILKPVHPSFINSAFACSPSQINDRIEEVVITSDQDYSQNFPSGQNLFPIMDFRSYIYTGFRTEPEDLLDYMALRGVDNDPFLFTFNTPPAENGLHSLTIVYHLNDGRQLESSITNIPILK